MHLLVLQHAWAEHPGIFRRFLQEDGHSWDAVHLDEGQALPELDGYDGLWVLGGPMDAWQEEAYPWLIVEKPLFKKWLKKKVCRFLGFALAIKCWRKHWVAALANRIFLKLGSVRFK